jgi:IS30 family transposase
VANPKERGYEENKRQSRCGIQGLDSLHRASCRLCRSHTYHQGSEMREHRLFTKQEKMRVYFAYPHCPWEWGTTDNTNGLLCQFFPKDT